MKKLFIGTIFALTAVALVRANDLQIGPLSGCYSSLGGGAWFSKFSLPGTTGTGVLFGQCGTVTPGGNLSGNMYLYGYGVDLSGIQGLDPGDHCISLRIYFGTPESCSGNQIEVIHSSGDVPLLSATEAYSSITVKFGASSSPCLSQGQASDSFNLLSDQPPKLENGYLTIIDVYTNPIYGTNLITQITVPAYVPDIPVLGLSPLPPLYQGVLQKSMYYGTNPVPAPSGIYDLGMQLYNAASNGLPLGPMMTQSVMVSNGLFIAPMNFDPSAFFGGQRWLSLSVSPAGSNSFTTLNPPQPISPAPQAIYAYTAGSVADLAPGQAVTSLNGLTDTVNLQAGSGIVLGTNGNALVISALPGGLSDRNLKTDFATVNPVEVLAKVAGLPMSSWRYTNELAQVRHIGPMAQDFMQVFRLGSDDKLIGYVDENGVALAAIQGLYQKMEQKEAMIQAQAMEIQELNTRIEKLENGRQ